MRRPSILLLALCVLLPALSSTGVGPESEYRATGWFSCDRCARGRVESKSVGPGNRECSQKCIAEGATVVFVDEKAVAMFTVANPEAVKGQEDHYVEVVGRLDSGVRAVRVESFKVLKPYVAKCAKPRARD